MLTPSSTVFRLLFLQVYRAHICMPTVCLFGRGDLEHFY